MYLLELRVRLLEKMLTDFVDGVDIFLGLHRDADSTTLNKLQVGRWINLSFLLSGQQTDQIYQ